MEKVEVYKYERVNKGGCFKTEKVDDGVAEFLTWGVDYEEFEQGIGNYSVAIVKRADGSVESVPADMIKFVGQ